VDNFLDYFQKLRDDILEQFKDKPNIEVLQKAAARQLEDVYAFFYQLFTMRWLQNAEGVQLDGIGDIVGVSRRDALIWFNMAEQEVPMDDELYRLFLRFKIFLNTSEGTYGDIVKTLRMFWPYTPIRYSEYTDEPATMYFTTPIMPVDAVYDTRVLQIVSRVKAAGVALHFIIPVAATKDVDTYYATAASYRVKRYIICDQPDLTDIDTTNYSATAASQTIKREVYIE